MAESLRWLGLPKYNAGILRAPASQFPRRHAPPPPRVKAAPGSGRIRGASTAPNVERRREERRVARVVRGARRQCARRRHDDAPLAILRHEAQQGHVCRWRARRRAVAQSTALGLTALGAAAAEVLLPRDVSVAAQRRGVRGRGRAPRVGHGLHRPPHVDAVVLPDLPLDGGHLLLALVLGDGLALPVDGEVALHLFDELAHLGTARWWV
eukprot:7060971-Prymnesium_polylepis.1